VLGGTSGGLGLSVQNDRSPGSDTSSDLHTLSDAVRGLRQAVQSRNTGEALRLQAQLVSAVAVAQKAAEKDDSDQAKALRAALSDLQKGLDGDPMRLSAASAALDKLDGPTAIAGAPIVADVPQLATSLASRVDAFRAAASTNSKADLLRLQQEILTEVDQDSAALAQTGSSGSEQSASAVAFKAALDGVRSGVSGDVNKLDGARASLDKLAGTDSSAPAAAGTSAASSQSAKPVTDLAKFAADLDNTVASFQAAFQKNDTGTMLRLQRQLSDQAAQVDSNMKDAKSKPADEIRAAVASIRTAFAGDINQLDQAHMHLRAVSGTAAAGATPGSTTSAASAAATPQAVNVQVIAGGMSDSLNGLATAVRDHQSADEVARRRDAVRAAVTQAESALNGAQNDPRADRLRNALGAVREAAGGDDTKAASAQSALDAALKGQ
jgi:hypothetical protein